MSVHALAGGVLAPVRTLGCAAVRPSPALTGRAWMVRASARRAATRTPLSPRPWQRGCLAIRAQWRRRQDPHAARCACRTSRRRATADAGTRRPGHRAGVRHQGRRRTRRGQRAQRVPRCRQRHRDPRRLDTGELRHTFVSLVSDSDVRVKRIACLAGHTNSRTADLVYRQQLRPSWRKAPKPSASCSSTPHDQKVATDAHSELRTSQPSAVSVATTTGPSRRRRRPWRSPLRDPSGPAVTHLGSPANPAGPANWRVPGRSSPEPRPRTGAGYRLGVARQVRAETCGVPRQHRRRDIWSAAGFAGPPPAMSGAEVRPVSR